MGKIRDYFSKQDEDLFSAVVSDEAILKQILASKATVDHYDDHDDVIETREKKILRLVKNWLIDRRLMLHEAMSGGRPSGRPAKELYSSSCLLK